MTNARQNRMDEARKLIAKFFEHHTAVRKGPGLWRCAPAGTWVHGFFVAFLPSCIVVYGDIGEALFLPHHPSPARWVLGSLDCGLGYWLSKVPASIETKQFEADVANESLRELQAEGYEVDTDVVHDEREYEARLEDVKNLDLCEVDRGTDWTWNILWCAHALRWLAEKVGPELVED